MKSLVIIIGIFYSIQSISSVDVPVGEYSYSGFETKMAKHTRLLYNSSTSDVALLAELRSKGYSCKRFSRQHRCIKTYRILPDEVEINFNPDFYSVGFSDDYSVDPLVTESIVNQYEIIQSVNYDGIHSENRSYKIYVHNTGKTFLDPTLNKIVRFRIVDENKLSHLNVFDLRVSSRESYKIYLELDYIKN